MSEGTGALLLVIGFLVGGILGCCIGVTMTQDEALAQGVATKIKIENANGIYFKWETK